jgi:hypothetical protein
LGCPSLLLHLLDHPECRCVSYHSDIASLDAYTGGVVEGTADDEMDLQHGLGCQRIAFIGGCSFWS